MDAEGAGRALGATREPPVGEPLTEGDRIWLREVARCSRYVPLAVTRRCPHGFPAVHLAFHGEDGIPVGSLFWLACPQLVRALFALESEGALDEIRRRLDEDGDLGIEFDGQGESYRRLRARCLERAGLADRRPGAFLNVGGVSDGRGVKCLHALVAFTLSTGEGRIGRELVDRIHEEGTAPCWFGSDDSGLPSCSREVA